ncbi:MAG TPA: aminotransferase class I/II-fold pyridoxal phosphate-dependent enzyme [Candidatus Dormibacteraeota bacterium]|nr:aminotransferase class I/II-fold pyridoxal phosphate-dependent enzyme [Candidatus Dormibacteraeota bacterium]
MDPIDTLAVHAGALETPLNAPVSPPLYQASAYVFEDLEDVEAIYGGRKQGKIYGRYGGPNGEAFAAAVAELEGAEAGVGASSGMAAICAAFFTNLRAGDHAVVTQDVYGGTHAVVTRDFPERGIESTFVDACDPRALRASIRPGQTKLVYLEALTNPLMRVPACADAVRLAHDAGAIVVVDSTFASPALFHPLEHGADLVVHSVTKYLGGHGDVGAGVLAGSRALIDGARAYLVRTGSTIPHFEAWLAHRGLRTLALRMERHSRNAEAAAAFLDAAGPAVTSVHHPSLPGHPQHAAAARLFPLGCGGMLSFELAGGRAAVEAFVKGLTMIEVVHSLGEVATTVSYSVASSHRGIPAAEREKLGVTESLLRLSCGIERGDDIIEDLRRGLEAAREKG